MSTSTNGTQTVNLLLFDTDPQLIGATVVYANPTATAYKLGCMPGEDDCGTFNEFVTVGPWAQTSPAASVTTGVYDLSVDMPDEDWSFSIHCVMSGTVPATCTTTNVGGNDDDGPTAVYTSPATDDSILAWAYMPVTIVAGQEKLGGADASAVQTASASAATSTSAPIQSTGSSMSGSYAMASPASGSGSRSAMAAATSSAAMAPTMSGSQASGASSRTASAQSSGSAVATTTANAAAQVYGSSLGSVALAAVALSWFVR